MQQLIIQHKISILFIVRDENSVRETLDGAAEPESLGVCPHSLLVQHGIQHSCGRTGWARHSRISFCPGFSKEIEAIPLAFGAGPVSGRQSGRFIEEEQLGIPAGRHDGAFSAFELKQADDPAFALKSMPNLPMIVVQTAAVSHERPTRRGGYQCAKWGYAVLSWHHVLTGNSKSA